MLLQELDYDFLLNSYSFGVSNISLLAFKNFGCFKRLYSKNVVVGLCTRHTKYCECAELQDGGSECDLDS